MPDDADAVQTEALVPATPSGLEPRQVDSYPLAKLTDGEFTALLARVHSHYNRLRAFQRELMQPLVHFTVPGKRTPAEVLAAIQQGQTPGLTKAGAEVLLKLHGLVADVETTVRYGDPKNLETPAISVTARCLVHSGSLEGPVVGVGVAASNSWEVKYRYRTASRTCPSCGKPTLMRSKYPSRNAEIASHGLPWWCNSKREGCGMEFAADDPAVIGQDTGRTPNEDVHDLENTLVKMAAKRGKVDGTITAIGASDLFTQDLEDIGGAQAAPASSEDPDAWRDEPATGGKAEDRPLPAVKPASEKQIKYLRTLLVKKWDAKTPQEQDATLATRTKVGHGFAGLTSPEAGIAIEELTALPDTQMQQKREESGAVVDTTSNRDVLTGRVRMVAKLLVSEGGPAFLGEWNGVECLIEDRALGKLGFDPTMPEPLAEISAEKLVTLGKFIRAELDKLGAGAKP